MINENYKISVFGLGYVGLTTALGLASFGHKLICVDVDEEKIKKLQKGKLPIFEKDLDKFLKKYQKQVEFTTDYQRGIKEAEIIFITVGTPFDAKKGLDLSQVYDVGKKIGQNINGYKIIVNKSTVPVGTAEKLKKIIAQYYQGPFDVVSNPEFLREGKALKDFLHPARIVIGAENKKAARVVANLYRPIKAPQVLVDTKSAELIKYVSNAFLATKISFINEVANLCERIGADIDAVREGMKYDPRIGDEFLNPGIGYGGSCFPKDTHALALLAGNHGYKFNLLKAVISVNNEQRKKVCQKAQKILGSLRNKSIAVWGLAFKAGTDDVRESVAIYLIKDLKKKGVKVKAYDPQGENSAKKLLSGIIYTKDPYQAVKGCELLIIATEWPEFKGVDFSKVKRLMKKPIIIDGRNWLNPAKIRKIGFDYYGVGRK